MRLLLIFALTFTLSAQQTPPYDHPVSGGLHPGMAVYIEGTVPQKATRFVMNFLCGRDILFHFNPRFPQQHVVLNICQSGRWGKEEVHKMPFQKGEHFEAIFIVKEAEYQVLVNGSPFCKFKHRIYPQFLKSINFGGNLVLQSMIVVGSKMERTMFFFLDIFLNP
ncbi:galectin-6-like [Pseudonaja textilis]|uniref:galectin-6-like n=1 Tax=Pseudonaja textilis TaxID=8673 RepID=UPI000EA91257|nr:galectin-6-like [Pseudonaja textilis]